MDIFGWVLAVISTVEFPFHAKGIVMNSITWSQINVPLPSNTEALSGKNFLEITKKCMLIVNCNVICKSDGKFFMTAEILDPDLCYDEAKVVVQCWTSKKSETNFFDSSIFYTKLISNQFSQPTYRNLFFRI